MKALRLSSAVLISVTAFALASGSSALPGNGRIVIGYEGGLGLANPDGSDLRPFVSVSTISSPVVWSPDGERLAFGERNGLQGRTYVVDADGTGRQELLHDESGVFFPFCWLPGDQIVLASYHQDPYEVDLWLVRSDGTGLRRLTTDGAPKRLSNQPCSADGSRIAYSAGNTYPLTAYWIATSGSEPVRLTPEGSSDEPPTLSPDGRYAAVPRGRPGPYEGVGVSVLRLDLETGAAIPLSMTTPGSAEALWSPNGDRLVLSAVRYMWPPGRRFPYQFGEVSLLASDGSSEVMLTKPGIGTGDFTASWSPDGTRLIFSNGNTGPEPVTRVMNQDGTCPTTVARSPEFFVPGGWQPLPGAPVDPPIECIDLAVASSVSDLRQVVMGEEINLPFQIHNRGNLPATNIEVEGSVAAGLKIVSIDASRGSCSPSTESCQLGTIAPREYVDVTITLRSMYVRPVTTSSSVLPFTIRARSMEPDPDLPDNSVITEFIAWACTKIATVAEGELLAGTSDRDILCGFAGTDRLIGLAGNDVASGGSARDRLEGGLGKDRLEGGPGQDTLLGGRGADIILGRDGTVDVIDCGPGKDAAFANRGDRVRRCERVWRL